MSRKGLSSSTAEVLHFAKNSVVAGLEKKNCCTRCLPILLRKREKVVKPYFLLLNKAAHFIVTKSFVLSKTSNKQVSHVTARTLKPTLLLKDGVYFAPTWLKTSNHRAWLTILAGSLPAFSLSAVGVARGKVKKIKRKSYLYKAKFEKYFF